MPDRKVVDLLASSRIVRLAPQASVREASRLMVREHVGAILVTEGEDAGGKLLGIFTERDALNRVIAADREPELTTLAEVMTPEPVTVSPGCLAVEALSLMRDGGFRHLPVAELQEDGSIRVVGVISLRDFVGAELARVQQQANVSALAGGHSGRGKA